MADGQNISNSGQGGSNQSAGNDKGAVNQVASQSKLLAYSDQDISAETQEMLNKPLEHAGAIDPKDLDFLSMLMDKIDKGEIDLYRPDTLLNHPVYDKLEETAKGKADLDAFNLLSTVREIRKLWNLDHRNTYQIENLTHRIRITKEHLEELGGDIYII